MSLIIRRAVMRPYHIDATDCGRVTSTNRLTESSAFFFDFGNLRAPSSARAS